MIWKNIAENVQIAVIVISVLVKDVAVVMVEGVIVVVIVEGISSVVVLIEY